MSATSATWSTGDDFNRNARLPRGGFVSGGVRVGHDVTDVCQVAGQASVTSGRSGQHHQPGDLRAAARRLDASASAVARSRER